jgi:hypothetical protein
MSQLTPLHHYVLRWLVEHELALPEEIAANLDVPLALIDLVCRELETEGRIAPAVAE